MAKLLRKEFALFAHPTSWMFLAFGAMMLIPGYPMYLPIFFASLGLFYACLSARENNDLYYTLLLPVRKRDAVRARALYFVIMELMQLALCVPFAILRGALKLGPNPAAVGKPFLVVSLWVFLLIFALEACCFVLPFFRDVLDTPDPQHLGAKLAVLAAGAALFVLLTALGTRRAETIFEKVDL